MALLIDGYNLLHVTGIFGKGRGVASLARSRRALLNFLGNRIDDDELRVTTIVFDAKDAPPGLPRTLQFNGMTVRFASDHAEADDLIEELIRADTAPRQLTVVSSDHRIQRAARRRRATPIDSETWYAELIKRRSHEPQSGVSVKPSLPLSELEIEAWLDEFADVEDVFLIEAQSEYESLEDRPQKPDTKDGAPIQDLGNPFPPGYADDLLEDDSDHSKKK